MPFTCGPPLYMEGLAYYGVRNKLWPMFENSLSKSKSLRDISNVSYFILISLFFKSMFGKVPGRWGYVISTVSSTT
jgi:hypothetical protein